MHDETAVGSGRTPGAFRLGIIGDLHNHWDETDVRQIGALNYDLLYFTGDLGGGTSSSSLRMARLIARLRGPALVMPGNNDAMDIDELAAELNLHHGINEILSITHNAQAPGDIALCGYSHHPIQAAGRNISLIAGRPHSMGGPELTFSEYMAETYGIETLADSEARLKQLVDEAGDEIIFLGHNGPFGLGEGSSDMWGCDFKAGGGDWGDTDLAATIEYARDMGKSVLAVLAGHMHLRTMQGDERPWLKEVDDIVFVNAARVPRIFDDRENVFRHHVELKITHTDMAFEEVFLPEFD
ncbi:MAG: metallophosphoesterase [Pseudomonadota bacterium]